MNKARKQTKPRILITGGAGFLGSHLCDRYLAEGYEVICMDNLSTGSADNRPPDRKRRLQLCQARCHQLHFLLASTNIVYRGPKVHSQKEDYCGNVNPIDAVEFTTRSNGLQRHPKFATGILAGQEKYWTDNLSLARTKD